MMFVRAQTTASGTTTATAALPTGIVTGDILFLLCECNIGNTVTTPTGYTAVTGSPFTGADTSMSIFWRRHTAGDTASACAGTTDHISVTCVAIAGLVATGTPVESVNSGATASGTTALTYPVVTPSAAGYGLLFTVASGADATTDPLSSATTPSIDSTTIVKNFGSTSIGGGGGVSYVYGQQSGTSPVATSATGVMANTLAKVAATLVLIPAADTTQKVANEQVTTVVNWPNDTNDVVFNMQVITVVNQQQATSRRRQSFSPC